jgi:hypothetical protein
MEVSLGEKVFWILAYSACSSSMLIINKLAVQNLPLPTVCSGAQLAVSAGVVVVMQMMVGRACVQVAQVASSLPIHIA